MGSPLWCDFSKKKASSSAMTEGELGNPQSNEQSPKNDSREIIVCLDLAWIKKAYTCRPSKTSGLDKDLSHSPLTEKDISILWDLKDAAQVMSHTKLVGVPFRTCLVGASNQEKAFWNSSGLSRGLDQRNRERRRQAKRNRALESATFDTSSQGLW